MSGRIFIDSFSGDLADLMPRQRSPRIALNVLKKSPRVSCFDMDKRWLQYLIRDLKRDGLIEELPESYPWIKFALTEKGEQQIKEEA